jgi:hypothetical protein
MYHRQACLLALCWVQEALETARTNSAARRRKKQFLSRMDHIKQANTIEVKQNMTSRV